MSMNYLSIQSPAKINLGLKTIARRKDGYHQLETVFQQVQLSDVIHFENTPDTTKFTCTETSLISEGNLICKAAILLSKKFSLKRGVTVHLEKNIPIAAGLGGGSSNAAITLQVLNRIWELNLRQSELIEMAKDLGADVPFFLYGARAIGTERGDQLSPLPNHHKYPIVLVNPGIGISAAWVYKNLNLGLTNNRNDIKLLALALRGGDIQQIGKLLFNDLESVLLPRFPVLEKIKALLIQSGAAGTIVSGSGSTVFAIFENLQKAEKAAKSIKDYGGKNWRVFLTETLTEEEVSSILKINLLQ